MKNVSDGQIIGFELKNNSNNCACYIERILKIQQFIAEQEFKNRVIMMKYF